MVVGGVVEGVVLLPHDGPHVIVVCSVVVVDEGGVVVVDVVVG